MNPIHPIIQRIGVVLALEMFRLCESNASVTPLGGIEHE